MNMKQSCKALICAIEGELDGRHCTEEQAAAILDHALPSLTEALARVEAERDLLRDQCQSYIRTGNEVLVERDTAQALLREVEAYPSGHGDNAVCNGSRLHREIKDLLATPPAAAPVAAGEPVAWLLPEKLSQRTTGSESEWWWTEGWNDCLSHLAENAPPAAAHGELVAVVGTVPDGSGFKSLDFKVGLESLQDGTRLYAAAHGDEAVRKPELVGYFSFCEDKQKWLQQKPKGAEFNHLFTPLYTMRAQGDGGQV